MKKRNIYWMLAGAINLVTAVVHLIGGQLDLVNPLLSSDISKEVKAQWLGAWHIVTIALFLSSFYLIRYSRSGSKANLDLIKYIGASYILFSIPFLVVFFTYSFAAIQWVLLLPIGLLVIAGIRHRNAKN